ncbi:MAG: ubiquitin fusion degradation protein UFD1-domain-containing protein [Monoraphidium minutum]|nr:MAG: ubiquitin fusion degradation protein UFD1-domain-containing protein [Monoraphidium minutum]
MFNFYDPVGMGSGHFEATYRAFPLAFIDKQSAEYGDKVIMPPSALDRLASLHIEYPMLFKVENGSTGRSTHCGVLEFIAQEGHVYLPRWMMQNLLLTEGQAVRFRNVSLPKGTFVKLQPVTSDFLDISNPKAVLERTLRSYSCLTLGDCFVFHYNAKDYEIEVRETRPGEAISIIETDCQVEFEAPKDYKEPERVPPPQPPAAAPPLGGAAPGGAPPADEEAEEDAGPKFAAFVGRGNRLDGKPAVGGPAPAAGSAAAAAAARAGGASTSGGGGGGGGAGGSRPGSSGGDGGGGPRSKAGTFVSTGNRLLDKLERERLQKQGGAAAGPPPAAAAAADEKKEEDEGPKFEAFKGKGYSLKG